MDTACIDTSHRSWYYKRDRFLPDSPVLTYSVGQWDLGHVGYDYTSMAPRGKRFVAYVHLAGLVESQGHFSTEALAKTRVQDIVAYWIANLEYVSQEVVEVSRVGRRKPATVEAPARITRAVKPVSPPVARLRRAVPPARIGRKERR